METANKVPVLVTGGAGYIGSHAVLALRDAGWPTVVIDNLSTGFAFAVPEDVPLYEGDIADSELLARIFAEHGPRGGSKGNYWPKGSGLLHRLLRS